MARGANITVENNFTKGLITEFTAMNFPENAVTDAENCVFSELGRVTRRRGINYEDDFFICNLTSSSSTMYTEYEWFFVSDSGTKTFVVQQAGSMLHFFEIGTDVSISGNLKNFSVNLMTHSVGASATEVASHPCAYATARGYLIVVHPFLQPFRISYDPPSPSVSATSIAIEIRDFEGVEDGLDVDERPVGNTLTHQYNLYNQGWYFDDGNYFGSFVSGYGRSPSNADVWWVYKDVNENFDVTLVDKFTLGNTPAAKGHYIYNAFDVNRTAMTGLAGLLRDFAGKVRPSCVAFFAGRAFYAGTSADGWADKIYFSQIVERDDQLGKCYQVNDPTSETLFDLLESDGGVVVLPQVKNILAMRVQGDALIIIATNGTFAIRGADNGPFRATSYTIENVSNVGGINQMSVVETPNSLFWWNTDNIYQIGKDQIGVYFKVENITKTTINAVIRAIPEANKPFIKGAYNKADQTIQWVYSDSDDYTECNYNKILVLNLISGAFYVHTISSMGSNGPRICGIISVSGQSLEEFLEDVVDASGVVVEDALGNDVTIVAQIYTPTSGIFKYPTEGIIRSSNSTQGFTYSQMTDLDFVDWRSYNGVGVSYSSYCVSGYRIRGELLRKFNSSTISIILDADEDGSCLFDGIWDYGARISTMQELYRSAGNATYLIRRVKLRGKGKSLQLRFSSNGNAPFSVIGWSTFDTGGQQP